MKPGATAVRPADAPTPLQSALSLLTVARRKLRRTVTVLAACWIVTFFFAQEVTGLLARPLVAAWARHREEIGDGAALHFKGLVEPFWVYMSLAFWLGLILATPYLFYQLWRAVTRVRAPGGERYALPFSLISFGCFVGGALFCYFVVLPLAFDFFLGYADRNLASMQSALGGHFELARPLALKPALFIDPYLKLTIRLLIAFGLVFELPIAIFFLSSVGLVTHRGLWRFNRWAVVLAFVVAAILTPGPDIVSQLAMAIPLIILYNLSIGIAYLVTRRRARASAPPGS
ncbi:MAG TPA: twin-arginine translocase subunit TatC [Kofleriaceae bacterium]|nr:twin-arginine translocase subunit TatC [Kofleriaceae bacterium]